MAENITSFNSVPLFVNTKKKIRHHLRNKRRQLPTLLRNKLSEQMCSLLTRQLFFKKSTRIAFYLSNDGEISLQKALYAALAQNKRCYLPVICSAANPQMRFALFNHRTTLIKKKFGIFEPLVTRRKHIAATSLDLVLMPLVAFDLAGNRLGMGGGFYDKTFGFLSRRKYWKHPKLIGVAYDFQQIENLPGDVWDIPLDGVITNNAFINMVNLKLRNI